MTYKSADFLLPTRGPAFLQNNYELWLNRQVLTKPLAA